MNSARQLASHTLPPEIDELKIGKQKLWNAVVTFLNKGGHVWCGSEVVNSGVALVRALVDTLWTIDGHHDTLCSRSYPIPEFFSCFSGYNVPEKSNTESEPFKTFHVQHCNHVQMPFLCVCKRITGQGKTGMGLNQKLRHLPSLSLNIAVIYLNSVLLAKDFICILSPFAK